MDWFRRNYSTEFHANNWLETPADHFVVKFTEGKPPEAEIHFHGVQRSRYHGYEEVWFHLSGRLQGVDSRGKLVMSLDPQIVEDRVFPCSGRRS